MSVLVRANVSIGGLSAGEVGEIPDGLYESARKRGFVEAVDKLESRLKPPAEYRGPSMAILDPASFIQINPGDTVQVDTDEPDGIDHELPAPPPLP